MLLILYFSLSVHWTISQELISPFIFSDCKHLILPVRCQCYHSGHESQLRCLHSELHSLPKLPNNMRWNALDFSYNYITAIDNYVFADIYVEKIILKSNYLRRIETTAFNQIKNLKELRLNHNQLKEFDPDALTSPGESLEIFDLSYNPFYHLDIGAILLKLPLLREFHVAACQLNDTSFYTLSKMIESISEDGNRTMIKNDHHHLEILDLSHNNISTLCSDVFDGLYNLIELRLQYNSIYLIDNNILRPFVRLRFLNLAHNEIEFVPKLSSRSLEIYNLSSNKIQHLGDYFASNLNGIQSIDFDHNHHLNITSSRAFCFLDMKSLKQITFRHNNLLSLSSFSEFLCHLLNHTDKLHLIDINHNINLKCHCTIIQFQNYFNHYQDLTCTQQGQDRYYISKLTHWFSNCSFDICLKKSYQLSDDYCNKADAERAVHVGTCQAKLRAMEDRRRKLLTTTAILTTLITSVSTSQENLTDYVNSTTIVDNSTRSLIEKSFNSNMRLTHFNWWFSIFLVYFSLMLS